MYLLSLSSLTKLHLKMGVLLQRVYAQIIPNAGLHQYHSESLVSVPVLI